MGNSARGCPTTNKEQRHGSTHVTRWQHQRDTVAAPNLADRYRASTNLSRASTNSFRAAAVTEPPSVGPTYCTKWGPKWGGGGGTASGVCKRDRGPSGVAHIGVPVYRSERPTLRC